MRDSCGTSGQVRLLCRKATGGSPDAPRKVSILKRKSTHPKTALISKPHLYKVLC
ncbi:hypothetical protein QUF49_09895 [Fictibacillus sp. b24]|uniref:hypothetical protein n=1 Tax=Fictibacillus sp. b24 TaxID=3055863 RepID=UPI0025A2673E|nr:hypothetical protein [Fictibacillus sp. b24]MDM5316306.1 hypothetical protein [Fictibacillus sp. b24]